MSVRIIRFVVMNYSYMSNLVTSIRSKTRLKIVAILVRHLEIIEAIEFETSS